MHIIMQSDDMIKIEVRNVEKYPLFAVFYEVFFSMGNHSIFIYANIARDNGPFASLYSLIMKVNKIDDF